MQSPSKKTRSGRLLRFKGVLVVVGGGAVDARLLKRLAGDGAAVVAADGGADACARAGIVPAAIIGDIDSLKNPARWAKRTKILRIEEQLTTDFEKCLYSTEARVTIALGMTGRRLDHTLAALDAVMRHAEMRKIILVDQSDVALAVSGSFSFAVKKGERVSVHPLAKVRFASSEGLLFPLNGLTLAPGVRTGTSNAAIEGPFSIIAAKGQTAPWLLILAKRNLEKLVAQALP